MRRLLIVDDPRLAPRLGRLRNVLGDRWDTLVCPADQVSEWRQILEIGSVNSILSVDVAAALPTDGPLSIVVAATHPDLLALASRLKTSRESTFIILPDARQTADWAYSFYALSESRPPRVAGLFEHRVAPAVQEFQRRMTAVSPRAHLTCQSTIQSALISDSDLERSLFQDVDLLRQLAGEFKSLIAVSIPGPDGGRRSVTITLGGDECATVAPNGDICAPVAWTLQAGSEPNWSLRGDSADSPILTRTTSGEYQLEGSLSAPEPSTSFAPWNDVLRAFDDLAALRRSLKRKRLVELQTEIVSERAQFKSLMSASGCGLLMVTLFGSVALLALGAAFDPRESLQRTSERAGLVLVDDDFEPGQSALIETSAVEITGMIRRLGQSSAPILIERTDDSALDESRRAAVTSAVENAGIPSPATRVELYALRGHAFRLLMTAAWVLLFFPLGLFLAMQALLVIAPQPDKAPH